MAPSDPRETWASIQVWIATPPRVGTIRSARACCGKSMSEAVLISQYPAPGAIALRWVWPEAGEESGHPGRTVKHGQQRLTADGTVERLMGHDDHPSPRRRLKLAGQPASLGELDEPAGAAAPPDQVENDQPHPGPGVDDIVEPGPAGGVDAGVRARRSGGG